MAHQKNLQEAAQSQIAALVDGNGIKGRTVKVLSCEAFDARLFGYLDVTVLAKSETRRFVGPTPPGSEICKDVVDFNRRVREIEHVASNDAETVSDLVGKVGTLPGNGWGMERSVLNLGRPVRRFSYSEKCKNCNGTTQIVCPTCYGSGQQKCGQCQGTSYEPCQACFGKPIMGPNGPQMCQVCHGGGLQKCRNCNGSGSVSCQTCQTRGRIPCPECQATGVITVATKIDLSAHAIFVIDPASVPEPLRAVFQKNGHVHLTQPGIARQITLEKHEIVDGSVRIRIAAELSWAKVELQVGKRKLSVIAYGEKPVIGPIPPILDKLTQPGVDLLAQAVVNPGNSINLIRQATAWRLIRLACQWAIKDPRVMMEEVLAVYPQGVSRERLVEIRDYLRLSFQTLTRKPRFQALWLCLMGNIILAVAHVWFGMRERLLDMFSAQSAMNGLVDFGVLIDIGVPLSGLLVTAIVVSFVSKRALKFALPGLFIGSGPKMADTAANQLGQALLAGDDDEMPRAVHGALGRDLMLYLLLIPLFHLVSVQIGVVLLHEGPPWFVRLTGQQEQIYEKPPRRVGKDPVGILEWNLTRLGLNAGRVDGVVDRQTQIAIAYMEQAAGKPVTGKPTEMNQQLAMVALEDHIYLDFGSNPMALGPAAPNRIRGRLTPEDVKLASAALHSGLKSVEVPIVWLNEKNQHTGDVTVLEADDNTGCIEVRHRMTLNEETAQARQKACWSEDTKKWVFHRE